METGIAHCLIVPYPIQGHINPMLQFAKRLAHKRVKVTYVVTKFLHKSMKDIPDRSISVRAISDGFDEGGRAQGPNAAEYRIRLRQVGEVTLAELLKEIQQGGEPVDCVVYDPFMPWVRDVAKRFVPHAAVFFTQSCAVDNIYYQVYTGELKVPISQDIELFRLPGLPPLKPDELPSFVTEYEMNPEALQMAANQFQNVDSTADWVLVNTFDKLEEEGIDWLSKFFRVKAIGPTVPSMYLDKRLQEDTTYGINVFKPISGVCMDWLNKQQSRSVMYVSFGSIAQLSVEQTKELACALMSINKPFLWVVRAAEEAKLPENFLKETSEKGLTVSWCPQLEVLLHEALGCFVTHCGWNSTLEALSFGVPLVGMPQRTDQSTNAKFVEDVWKVGVRAKVDKEELSTREEIARCITHVMDGDEAERIRRNVIEWKGISKEAVDEGGSSDKNIDEFVSVLTKRAT